MLVIAAALMGRPALALLALVVVIGIPINPHGTSLVIPIPTISSLMI